MGNTFLVSRLCGILLSSSHKWSVSPPSMLNDTKDTMSAITTNKFLYMGQDVELRIAIDFN
jgi:pre-mRNA-processing factor 8